MSSELLAFGGGGGLALLDQKNKKAFFQLTPFFCIVLEASKSCVLVLMLVGLVFCVFLINFTFSVRN